MDQNPPSQITEILQAVERGGSPEAEEELWAIVYDELRAVAARLVRNERPSATLQPTAIVGETYLRLFGKSEAPSWENRRHFFGAANRAMRQLLIDRGRKQERMREDGARLVTLQPTSDGRTPDRVVDPILLAESLDKLEAHDERAAQVVMLRFFAGLSHEEIACALELSVPTVKRDWTYGKSWLRAELGETEG